jgi:cation diffusion facilitator family transporter
MIDASKAIALGALGLAVNVVLTAVKITAGILGHSHALVADGIESAGDILTSLATWIGFRLSLRPPDSTHPFGHGKIESLAGLFSGLCLIIAAAAIAWSAILEIASPTREAPEWFTLPVLVAVVAAKWFLARLVMRFGREIDSRAIEGDARHHLSDAATSAAAAVGISISLAGGPGWETADDYAALLACAVIVLNGTLVAKRSLHEILDGNVPAPLEDEMRQLASAVPGVAAIEKCRIRKSGTGIFVELHVGVHGDTTVRQGHLVGHRVKDHIMAANPRVLDVVVHLEPSTPS